MNWKTWALEARSAWSDKEAGKSERWDAEIANLEAALRDDPRYVGLRKDADYPAALDAAGRVSDSAAALDKLRDGLTKRFPALRPVLAGENDTKPEPLLWGVGVRGGVLCRGELAVLSGAGGRGKSTLALQWALAGALADASHQTHGESGGMGVKAGRAAFLSYEDSAWRVAQRATAALALPSLKKLAKDITAVDQVCDERVRLAELRGWPLFGVEGQHHAMTRPDKLEAWKPAWTQIAEMEAGLVIVDPAMSAYVADANAVTFVRLFLDALYAAAQEHNCGVLLVAHSSKAARRQRDADTTGNVAGSAAWTDAARGVLTLDYPAPPRDETDEKRLQRMDLRELDCEKSNYSKLFKHELVVKMENSQLDGERRFLGFEAAGTPGESDIV